MDLADQFDAVAKTLDNANSILNQEPAATSPSRQNLYARQSASAGPDVKSLTHAVLYNYITDQNYNKTLHSVEPSTEVQFAFLQVSSAANLAKNITELQCAQDVIVAGFGGNTSIGCIAMAIVVGALDWATSYCDFGSGDTTGWEVHSANERAGQIFNNLSDVAVAVGTVQGSLSDVKTSVGDGLSNQVDALDDKVSNLGNTVSAVSESVSNAAGAGQLTNHDSDIKARLGTTSSLPVKALLDATQGKLTTHDTDTKDKLAKHDTDLKNLLLTLQTSVYRLQASVDYNTQQLKVIDAFERALTKLVLSQDGQKVLNAALLTCTGDNCPSVTITCSGGVCKFPQK
ncbi:MAG: hypothetical protein HY313_05075 [Acidobacteria bacterium]|nr:hypothetical protein [Acidobacteriota bacterium]